MVAIPRIINFNRCIKCRYILLGLIVFFISPLTVWVWIQPRLIKLDVLNSSVTQDTNAWGTNVHSNSISLPKNNPQQFLPLTLTGDYLLNNPQICAGVPRVTALVMVHTAPKHFARRENIRVTYGSRDLFENQVRVVFLLGLVKDELLQKEIEIEHKKYQDTVQGNFLDSYHNLTHKGVMGFRWITEHCSNVSYVVKVDDDAVFDMWRFLRFFGNKNEQNSIFGRKVTKGPILRRGKWKLEDDVMKGILRWPWPFCPGFVVILTGDVIERLLVAAHTAPFLWLDDVYLFGCLPFRVGNITLYDLPENLKLRPSSQGRQCLIEKGEECECLAVGGTEHTFMTSWNMIKKRNKK